MVKIKWAISHKILKAMPSRKTEWDRGKIEESPGKGQKLSNS